jgi:hypothetical protein
MFRPRAHTLPDASLDQLTGERKRRLVFVNSFTRVAAISFARSVRRTDLLLAISRRPLPGEHSSCVVAATMSYRHLGDARPSKAAPKPAGGKPKKSSSRPSDKEVERKAAVAYEREQKSDRD